MSSKQSTPEAAEPQPSDFVVVPEGRSRRQYLFTLGLMIFVLLIFTVGDMFQSSMGGAIGGGGQSRTEFTWKHPITGQAHEVQSQEFAVTGQILGDLQRHQLFRPWHGTEIEAEDVAVFLILEELAAEEGIGLSNKEFSDMLIRAFSFDGTPEAAATLLSQIAANTRSTGGRVAGFEAALRRLWTVQKLGSLLRMGVGSVNLTPVPIVGAADAERIRTTWAERNVQYRFDYVEAAAGDFIDNATAELPDAAGLEEWFDARTEFEKRQHFTDEAWDVQVAWVSLDEGASFDETALLEAYPFAEGASLANLTTAYYNLASATRFPNPDWVDPADEETSEDDEDTENGEGDDEETSEETTDEETGETTEDDEPEPQILPLEDVQELVDRESQIHRAMGSWRTELHQRIADATPEGTLEPPADVVDLAAEAAKFGLTFSSGERLTQEDIISQEWGGDIVAQRFRFPQVGTFLPYVVIEKNALVVVLVTNHHAPEKPEFSTIAEAVGQEWIDERAGELVTEHLDGFRSTLGERPEDDPATEDIDESEDWTPVASDEAFRANAETLGMDVYERPWLGKSENASGSRDDMSDMDRTFRNQFTWYDLEEGSVPAPVLVQTLPAAPDEEPKPAKFILARYVEERPKPVVDMTAAELFRSRQQAVSEASRALDESLFNAESDWFKATFELDMAAWEDREKRAAERAARDAEKAAEGGNAAPGGDGTSDDGTSDDGTSDDGTSDDGTSDDGTSDDGTSDDETSDDETGGDDETSDDETPGDGE